MSDSKRKRTDELRAYDRQKKKEYRAARLERRVCVVCAGPLEDRRKSCPRCLAAQAARVQKLRDERVAAGRCPVCGDTAAEGLTYCRACLDDVSHNLRKRRGHRRDLGVCESCGQRPVWREGAPTCTECKDRRQDNENRTNQKRREEGRCTQCGAERDDETRKRCVPCRAYHRARMLEARLACLDHYGRACACCGESELLFLQIDHVNNDGARHRKATPTVRRNLYSWLRRQGFPAGFQTLCANCNWGKRMNDGVCPHKRQ